MLVPCLCSRWTSPALPGLLHALSFLCQHANSPSKSRHILIASLFTAQRTSRLLTWRVIHQYNCKSKSSRTNLVTWRRLALLFCYLFTLAARLFQANPLRISRHCCGDTKQSSGSSRSWGRFPNLSLFDFHLGNKGKITIASVFLWLTSAWITFL